MAKAAAYNEYEDAGLAFSEEAIRSFHPLDALDDRIAGLTARYLWFARREEMNLDKPALTAQGKKFVRSAGDWYGKLREELPVWPSVPAATTEAGRALSTEVLAVSLLDYAKAWRDSAEAALRWYVSIARRAAGAQVSGRTAMEAEGEDFIPGRWRRAEHSLSNKTANAIVREWGSASRLVSDIEVYEGPEE